MSLQLRLRDITLPQREDFTNMSSQDMPLENRVKLLIIRDLLNLNWKVGVAGEKIEIAPPDFYDKETIRQTMSVKRLEIIRENRNWINNHLDLARSNLAKGSDVLLSRIDPVFEVCETEKQHKIFRIFRYYWSSPYSDYVGRRIKILIRDNGLPNRPVIGIAALGSPIIHIPERDQFIGWDKATRTKNLIYTMDAYVIGALPPYNYLLGGKLISMLLASNEIRKIYRDKYKNKVTLIDKRVSDKLVGIFTTSLYGRSSQYNRLSHNGTLLYNPIGYTKGFGTLHLSRETIHEMINLLKKNNKMVSHIFGDGPSWVMRIIRTSGELLGFDPDFLLNHSFRRGIYFLPLAKNYKEFLNGESNKPEYYNYSKKELVNHWKQRWLRHRMQNADIVNKVIDFNPQDFVI